MIMTIIFFYLAAILDSGKNWPKFNAKINKTILLNLGDCYGFNYWTNPNDGMMRVQRPQLCTRIMPSLDYSLFFLLWAIPFMIYFTHFTFFTRMRKEAENIRWAFLYILIRCSEYKINFVKVGAHIPLK